MGIYTKKEKKEKKTPIAFGNANNKTNKTKAFLNAPTQKQTKTKTTHPKKNI